jgi:hypothetical protein
MRIGNHAKRILQSSQYLIFPNHINNFSRGFLASIEHKTFMIEGQLPSCRFINTKKYIPLFTLSDAALSCAQPDKKKRTPE